MYLSEFPTKATRPNYSVLNKQKIKHATKIEIPYWKDSLFKFLHNHFFSDYIKGNL